jgi:ketose-bisphosphate aldolase
LPAAGPRLRVLNAADRPLLRAGIGRLLTSTGAEAGLANSGFEPRIEIVGEAATADAAVTACRELRPDVVLADLGLTTAGDGGGDVDPAGGSAGTPGVTELLLGQLPDLAVVGLCEAGDERLVAEAMRVGARGCVDTWADGPELARAIIAAGRGQAILSAPALAQLQRGLRGDAGKPALTERERQVRRLMEQGLPDKVIAERLVLSVKTVEKHAGAVLRKTGARNRAELAALAGRARPRPVRLRARTVRLRARARPVTGKDEPGRENPPASWGLAPIRAVGALRYLWDIPVPRSDQRVSVVPLKEIVDRAFRERYGVAAINVVNDLTMEAVLAAAVEQRSPVIVQTSVKTVRSIGLDLLFAMWREMTAGIDVPVCLHLDHCPDRVLLSDCLRKGWNSVLFDGSRMPVAENLRQTVDVVAEARSFGAHVEGEIEAITGVEDGIGSDEEASRQSLPVALDFIRKTGIDVFAPAIGNAHGVYRAEPHLDAQRVSDIVAAEPIPIALHGGTGMTDAQFRDLISRGCAKVNISTALKIAYMKSNLDFLRSAEQRDSWDPPSLFTHVGAAVTDLAAAHMRRFGSVGKAG